MRSTRMREPKGLIELDQSLGHKNVNGLGSI